MDRVWVEPLGLLHGAAARLASVQGRALPLAGGPTAFAFVRLIAPGRPPSVLPVAQVPAEWHQAMMALTRPLPPFGPLPEPHAQGRPLVMGIINVTPDSFSDGGRHASQDAAIEAGEAMLEAGADILDIGGESTRPGAEPVPAEEEMRRILPVVRELAKSAPVSVDTRNADTMQAALDEGAEIVNDISALRHHPRSAEVVARAEAGLVLMHMLGEDPRVMQRDPRYEDVALEVTQFLAARLAVAEAAGIPRHRILLDPGIGFGKTMAQNLELLDRLPLLAGLGCRVLVGLSRKAFVGRLSGVAEAGERLAGSLAGALAAASRGAAVLRVHDVAETVQALRMWQACQEGAPPDEA